MTRLLLALGLIAALAAQDPAPTPDPEATAPATDPTEAAAVSQYGITWTFSKPHRVGRFVTGDWWVVGPVEVVRIDPAIARAKNGKTERVMNGAMVDPPITTEAGFDSGPANRYKPERNVALGIAEGRPLTLAPGSSLLSAISNPQHKGGHDSYLQVIAVLTVLAQPPPPDAFRPPYVAGDKTVRYTFGQIDQTKLLKLKVVGEPPAWSRVERMLERPFIDFAPNWTRYHNATLTNGALYGRNTSDEIGTATLMLLSDYPLEQKRTTLIRLVQRGIDLHGIFAHYKAKGSVFPWRSDGGHSSGRKWPIIFAGFLLGDPEMQGVMRQIPGWRSAFQEDAQVVYVSPRHVALSNSPQWKPAYDGKRPKQPYSEAMLGMPEWVGKSDPAVANAHWQGHPYRRGPNGGPWHGMSLAALALGLKESWGHDAFFDYQHRYVAIMDGKPDPFGVLCGYGEVEGTHPGKPFEHWQRYLGKWTYDMWQAHWPTYYTMPTERPKPAEPPPTPTSEEEPTPGEQEPAAE